MGNGEMRGFARRAASASGVLRAAGDDEMASLLEEAAAIADDADETLLLADDMLKASVDFVVPFVNDQNGRRARTMEALGAYARKRGIRVMGHDGQQIL